VEELGRAAPVQDGGTSRFGSAPIPSRLDEALSPGHLPPEVAWVEGDIPDDLVDAAKVAHAKRLTAERCSDRRVLKLRPRPLQRLAQYVLVIECQRNLPVEGFSDGDPGRGFRVRARFRIR